MDSLINHYTANKKVRNDDAYSPGGRIGLRPIARRCRIATVRARRFPACRSSPAASRRRCAGWPITITGATPSAASILLDCKADLLVYGMGEKTIVEIARRLAAGQTVRDLRDMRGVAYVLGAQESRRIG